MIELENIFFQFPSSDFVLEISDLKIADKSRVAFIGPSGSGKSTLANIIGGFLSPAQGNVVVAGMNLGKLPRKGVLEYQSNTVGMIWQDYSLLEYLNVEENILLGAHQQQWQSHLQKNARKLLQDVGLAGKEKRFPKELSQGEKQRVAVARAFITKPSIIIADEPTASLDPSNKAKILELILQCSEEMEATLIFITHDHSLLSSFSSIVDFSKFPIPSTE